MKKKLFYMRNLFVMAFSLCFTLQLFAGTGEKKPLAYWQKMADGMSQALITHFWGANFEGHEKRYYFNYGSDLSNMTTNHYWPQAHAMDVIVDAYMRSGNKQYLDIYPLWWEGAPQFNFSGRPEDRWWNVFVDDMEWIALAQIRMFESTRNTKYLEKARQMYDDWIWPTWGPEDEAPWFGGITWKTDVAKSKNACSNGPAALIAARLYGFYDTSNKTAKKQKQAYLNQAVKIYMWEKNHLFDRQTGAVYDCMKRDGTIARMVFSYNVGTFLGAAHELYKITGDKQYLADAVKASDFVIDRLSTNEGVLSDATGGDGGLFHGIFFRYFVKLINEPTLDTAHRIKFHNYITRCATIMAEQGVNPKTMLYGGCWRKAPADNEHVALTPHLTGCMLMEAMCVLKPLSLVPDIPTTAPDYFCTWNVQGYQSNYAGSSEMRAAINEKSMFGTGNWEGWVKFFPKIRGDLYFVMDDSWDIPQNVNSTSNKYLGLVELDTTRFPSFTGNPAQRLIKLNEKVKSYGWKGVGGWICAQEAEIAANRNSVDDYWAERLKAAHEAGFDYWKVDWGKESHNDEWRKNLTRLGRIYAPNLYIEHAMKNEYIEFSDVFRTYDVENITATPVTIQRVANLLKYDARGNAKGIINCEDEPYIAVGLGCAIGVMRHPYKGNLPNGKQDYVFPPVGRNYKNRLDEVARGVRWHRIAEPFGVANDAYVDSVKLNDHWEVRADETWVNRKAGEVVRESAPARISRNMPLPQVTASRGSEVPFVMASRYPNGATAIVTTERTLGRKCVLKPIVVTAQMDDLYKPIGIFGKYKSLVLHFNEEIDLSAIQVLGQDLASDRAVEITDRLVVKGNRITVPGELIEAVGLMNATEGDESLPGLVIQVFKR